MKIRTLIFLFLSGVLLFLIFAVFLVKGIKNAKDCSLYVIDSCEIASGIDIPKQNESECYYYEETGTRISFFKIQNIDEFIQKYESKKSVDENISGLWTVISSDDPIFEQVQLNDYYVHFYGENKKSKWQSYLNPNTGILIFEIQWI